MAFKDVVVPIDKFFSPEKDKVLLGTLQGYQDLENGSRVLIFEDEDGNKVAAGQFAIVNECTRYSLGTLFKIEYRGTVEKSGGRSYHNFKIAYDDETGGPLSEKEMEKRIQEWRLEKKGRGYIFIEDLPF